MSTIATQETMISTKLRLDLAKSFLTRLLTNEKHSFSSGMREIFDMHDQDMELDATPEELAKETYDRGLISNFEVWEPELDQTGFDTLEELQENETIFELFCRPYVEEHVESLSISHPLAAQARSKNGKLFFELEAVVAPDGKESTGRIQTTIGYYRDKNADLFGIEFFEVRYQPEDKAYLTQWIMSLS